MREETKINILCIEDDSAWQNKIETVADKVTGFSVVFCETYANAIKILSTEGEKYDIFSLDSRLENNTPRLSQIIKQIKQKSKDKIEPVILAITRYSHDVSDYDRRLLFRFLYKEDKKIKQNYKRVLRKNLLEATSQSLKIQAMYIWRQQKQIPIVDSLDYLVKELHNFSLADTTIKKMTKSVIEKYACVEPYLYLLPEILLDCYGYVSEIAESEVEVILALRNGEDLMRVFDAKIFRAAGLYYDNAPFRYIIKREGASIYSKVKACLPPPDYPRYEKLDKKIDHNIFEQFTPSPQEQENG